MKKGPTQKEESTATLTCIPKADYLKFKPRPKLRPVDFPLNSPDGRVNSMGQFTATTTYKGTNYMFQAIVLTDSSSRLLSKDVAEAMGIIKYVEEVRHDVFGDFGLLKGEPIRIRLKPDAQPYNLATPRRISAPLLNPLKKELDRMRENGIISPITEPTAWCSPIVVMKANGKIRICVD